MTNNVIKILEKENLQDLGKNFKNTYLEGRENTLLPKYLEEQEKGLRSVVVAFIENLGAVGYATLVYSSEHHSFSAKNIPEIVDINTAPIARGKGLGTAMLKFLEEMAREKGYLEIGLGVGLYPDYGHAQRLYIKNGYIPDGEGLFYDNKLVPPGGSVIVDDSLAFYLTKELK